MIDDNKIEAAKEEIYEDRFLLNGEEIVFNNDEKEEMFYKEDIKEAIGLGAKWAINEILKDLWNPASEEPEKNHFVLFKTAGNSFETEYIGKNDWATIVRCFKVVKWFYVDDLLPKKGGEQ